MGNLFCPPHSLTADNKPCPLDGSIYTYFLKLAPQALLGLKNHHTHTDKPQPPLTSHKCFINTAMGLFMPVVVCHDKKQLYSATFLPHLAYEALRMPFLFSPCYTSSP